MPAANLVTVRSVVEVESAYNPVLMVVRSETIIPNANAGRSNPVKLIDRSPRVRCAERIFNAAGRPRLERSCGAGAKFRRVAPRRQSHKAAEVPSEMALIGETSGGGNGGERFARAQQFLRSVNANLVLISVRRHPSVAGKQTMDMKSAEIRQPAQIC